ncbi:hypothetical protein HN873_063040 [Arachis hypogaea]
MRNPKPSHHHYPTVALFSSFFSSSPSVGCRLFGSLLFLSPSAGHRLFGDLSLSLSSRWLITLENSGENNVVAASVLIGELDLFELVTCWICGKIMLLLPLCYMLGYS